MDTKSAILMLSELTMLLKGNKKRLESISGGNPSSEQTMAFQVYQQNIEQLMRDLLDGLAKSDSSLSDLISYRVFEMDLEKLLDESRISE